MKIASRAAMVGVIAATGLIFSSSTEATDVHTVLTSEEVEWSAAPPSLPPGAEAAVLFGDPSEGGLFALRLKLPEGYVIPPHSHPRPEVVTVISGTFHLGMGETADRAGAQALPAGAFFAFSPGMTHYAFVEEETVVQLNSTGPWGITYVDPADDPRQK